MLMPVTASTSSPARQASSAWTSRPTVSPRRSRSFRHRTTGRTAATSIAMSRGRVAIRVGHWSHERAPDLAAVVALVVLSASWAASVAAQASSTDHAIQLNQRQIQRSPQNAAAYLRLGDAYVQKARQTGDMSYCMLAEQALRRSLELAPQNAGAARHL